MVRHSYVDNHWYNLIFIDVLGTLVLEGCFETFWFILGTRQINLKITFYARS